MYIGMEPGYYALIRDVSRLPHLRELFPNISPFPPPGVSSSLPFFLLKSRQTETDSEPRSISTDEQRRTVSSSSKIASCNQRIASDSSFTVAMFSPLRAIATSEGPHTYRWVHWEAGIIVHMYIYIYIYMKSLFVLWLSLF